MRSHGIVFHWLACFTTAWMELENIMLSETFHSFLWLNNNIPLYGYIIFCLFNHQGMNIRLLLPYWYKYSRTAGPWITSFHYNIDKMLWELNSCLYQLAYGKIGFSMCVFTETMNGVNWGLTVQVFVWTFVFHLFWMEFHFFGMKPLDHMVNSMFNNVRNWQTLFQSSCIILHSHQQWLKVLISLYFQNLFLSIFWLWTLC